MLTPHFFKLLLLGMLTTLLMDGIQWLRHTYLGHRWFDFGLLGQALLRPLPSHTTTAPTNTVPQSPLAAKLLGWGLHYVIGVVLAAFAVSLSDMLEHTHVTLWFCLLFGMVSVVLPFTTMQPLLGLGFAASNTATPWQNRGKSLFTHTIFGLCLFVAAQCTGF